MTSETPRPTGLIATKGLELLTYGTPNGHKASILLEELKEAYGLEYTFQAIDLFTGVQKDAWYTALNPVAKIPILVDHSNNDFVVRESQAIVYYLARHHDQEHKFSFTDPLDASRCDQWISFGTSELSANVSLSLQFYRFIPLRIPFPTQQFVQRAQRAFDILNAALENRDYIVGPDRGKYSIADIVNWPYVNISMFAGVGELGRWKNLEEWWSRINAREGVKRGVGIPSKREGVLNEGYKEALENMPERKAQDAVLADELKKAQDAFGSA